MVDRWESISDSEYEALPLTAKIRHQKILANEAACKAGPMFARSKGGAIALEEMSEDARRWKTKAANHYAEAKRLRLILDDYLERNLRHYVSAGTSVFGGSGGIPAAGVAR